MVLAFVAIALLASPSLRLLRHAPKRPNELIEKTREPVMRLRQPHSMRE